MEITQAVITVNNDDAPAVLTVQASFGSTYKGLLSGETLTVENGQIQVSLPANNGEIWVPVS